MSTPAIHIEGLHKRFDDVEALRGLDLEIQPGEMFGLVGPDGAGKTTAIRILCGILTADQGDVRVLDFDLPRRRYALRDHIGYLSQRFSLYEDLTIDENIAFYAEIHQVRDFQQRREELLEFTRLASFHTRFAGKLSGGMRQKLALACTLIHRPRLILLDEPTTGVDPVARRDFWKLLADVRRQGVTILMSTPYLDEAERCTRVGLMNEGRLMVVGTPEEIRGLVPGTVAELVAPDIRRVAQIVRDTNVALDVQLFGDRLNVLLPDRAEATAALRRCLDETGTRITSWRTVPPSLENAFITLLNQGARG